jgi:hypothetical protein
MIPQPRLCASVVIFFRSKVSSLKVRPGKAVGVPKLSPVEESVVGSYISMPIRRMRKAAFRLPQTPGRRV